MPPPSSRIGRYEIRSPIGGGGMGSLFLARDPNTGRLVALKLLRAHLDSEDLKARFQREAQALASLNHPNIVDIYDSGQFRGQPFMVMEYVRGETLAEKIKRNAPMSLAHKLKLMSELCAGLGHAHESGIVHRDIKPANLMEEDRYRRLKIVDFGIARVTEGLTRFGGQMTQLNMQIGTPGYMSPEQIDGAEVDARSDLFAVGAVFYELLTYREAFPGASTRQIEKKVLEEQPVPLASIVPDLDPAIQAIVDRALQKAPDRRFQTAAEFEEAIEQARERAGKDTPLPVAKATPVPGRQPAKLSRAEATYQRSVELDADGALDTARRFAVETLVEDPTHVGAREMLRKLDPHGWVPPPPSPRPPSGAPVAPTMLAGSSETEPTALASAGPTVVSTRSDDASTLWGAGQQDWVEERPEWDPGQDETVVVPPRAGTPRVRSSAAQPVAASNKLFAWAAVGWATALAILVAAAAAITLLVLRPWESGYTLTILKPEGGTVATTGLVCGSGGDACVSNFEDGRVLEFEAKPDEGFSFVAFTGDCAPGGRTMMTGPRSCGATFAATPKEPDTRMLLLTVAPASGGTIVGSGINCGTRGKDCSVQHPEGTVVTLAAFADEGFRAGNFTGDCAPKGTAVMAGPLTCGATFQPRAPLKTAGGTGGGSGGTTAGGTGVRPGGGTGGGTAGGGTMGGGTTAGGGGGSVPGGTTTTGGGGAGAGGGGGAGSAGGGAGGKTEKVAPPISAEAHAQGEIEKVLRAYSAAYQNLDFPAIQRVWPTVPNLIRTQLRGYDTLEYGYAGPFDYKELDSDAGRAIVEVPVKQAYRMKVGQKGELEGKLRFSMHRRDDDWLIGSAQFEAKKK
jgi:serine/threonine protein kinase